MKNLKEKERTDMTQLTEYDEKIKELTEKIEKNPNNAVLYAKLGLICFYRMNDYENAIKNYTKAIELDVKYPSIALSSEFSWYNEDIADYYQNIKSELVPYNAILYFERGKIYNKKLKFSKAIDDYSKAIEIEPHNALLYYYRADVYKIQNKYTEAINDYTKAIEIYPKYEKKGRSGEFIDEESLYTERGYLYWKLKDYYKAQDDFYKTIQFYHKYGDGLESEEFKEIQDIYKATAEEIARIEERNKVLADLSHSIKNLIATVIDPLENLKNEAVVQPQIIQNALRGANLIREIVNAVNLSFKGSIDDFVYDAQHNVAKDSVNLESMLIESLRQSVGNMFDSKYFSNFMRKYFPKKEQYHEAKAGWTSISQSKDLKSLEQFLKSYFFETDFSFENATSYSIGNEKGSAVKLLILFQELILNAVKYSAFVSKEKRFLRIRFISNADTISVKVENPFDENTKTKTTGIGHVVIQNFATLLNTEPVISKENSIYSVVIQFKNLWQGSAQ